jgi:hypothetical protein
MRRLAGQAGRHAGRLLHALARLVFAAAVLGMAAIALLSWRLAQGPIDLAWLTQSLLARVNTPGTPLHLDLGSVSLAWEGFSAGADQPLDLRLSGLRLRDPTGVAVLEAPHAALSVSFGWLLLGQLAPRAITLDAPRLRLAHGFAANWVDGIWRLDMPGQGSAPPPIPLRWTALRRLRLHAAGIAVIDAALGTTWSLAALDLDLHRAGDGAAMGRIDGTAAAALHLAGQTVALAAQVEPAGHEARLRLRAGPLVPAALQAVFAPLAMLDAPVQASLALRFDDAWRWQDGTAQATIGAGAVHLGGGTVPIAGVAADVAFDAQSLRLHEGRLQLAAAAGAGPEVMASGTAARTADGYGGMLQLAVDRLPLADLGRYWPEGINRAARTWMVKNLPAGVARDGTGRFGFHLAPDFTHPLLTSATASAKGEDISVIWLPHMPPLEHMTGTLALLSPDVMELTAQGGREAGGALRLERGSMRITGLTVKDQYGSIEGDVTGPVADALALLARPALHLLARHPLALHDPAGTGRVHLGLGLLLDARTTFDDVTLTVAGQLADLHLADVVAGRPLDAGAFTLRADKSALHLDGSARLGGIPSEIGVVMDFEDGGPAQVQQRIHLKASPTAAQLAAAGLDTGAVLAGSIDAEATVNERRDGLGSLDIAADMASATLALPALGWRKPPGGPAQGSARIQLRHDRIIGIDRLSVQGEGLLLRGAADYAGGQPRTLRLDTIVLGRTQARGEVQFPATPGQPVHARLTGDTLDLSRRGHAGKSAAPPPERPSARAQPAGGGYVVDARFAQASFGRGHVLSALRLHAEGDAGGLRAARAEAQTGVAAQIGATDAVDLRRAARPGGGLPGGGQRQITLQAADAGALLRALDLSDTIEGGRLRLDATIDDRAPGRPVSGSASITDFRLRHAPVAARLLAAMSLYDLQQMLGGPGLHFTRLVAPFRLRGERLELNNARAFSPALGFTAAGSVDLATERSDLHGTIVPLYFFNTLLGDLPLIGRVFSPEKGGGLFAAAYSVRGPLADPTIAVNPLSALAPGFLRGLFTLFQSDTAAGPNSGAAAHGR